MFILMVVVFVLGYTAIALEHPLKVDKAASALFIGTALWVLYIIGGIDILNMGYSRSWNEFVELHNINLENGHLLETVRHFITDYEVVDHLGETSEILFFLLGAMTIVETVDQHQGFKVITDRIRTTKKIKLLWILTFITFFMSALLDNLTTTIVIVALLRKIIGDKKDRWIFASLVVLAANAGGAWSPIGDVTTIMLWVKGNVNTVPIIRDVIVPSMVAAVVPALIMSFIMKGKVNPPSKEELENNNNNVSAARESNLVFVIGVLGLLFVPVFKTVTHLPPYQGMLLSLSVLWIITEIMHKKKEHSKKRKLAISSVLKKVDVPTIFFFLGILMAVAALQSAGHLTLLAGWLDKATGRNIYVINLAIGVLSSIVDNVPLVAGAMGMYDVTPAGAMGHEALFMVDGQFWQFLAYCSGTGGSLLIIGSAAGVAAMGLEKIDFIWYMKNISLLALSGYIAGAATYYLMFAL